jgi:MFS family permease
MSKAQPGSARSFLLEANPVIRLLTYSDVVALGAMALLGPIFALFIVDRIEGGNAAVVGAAAAVALLTKSFLQVPAAMIIDRVRGERDDFFALLIGTVLIAAAPLLFLVIRTPIQLYAVEFLIGLGMAVSYPPYMAMFTRHIDRDKEGTQWGVRFTLIDLASAAAASLGGLLAVTAGFEAVIVTMSSLTLLAAVILIPVRKYVRMPKG